MNQKFDPGPENSAPIVYVRPISADELPEEMRALTGDLETLYSVHDAEGQRLAVVRDRVLAFALARQHDFAPENVH
jgi:hypothetical protein